RRDQRRCSDRSASRDQLGVTHAVRPPRGGGRTDLGTRRPGDGRQVSGGDEFAGCVSSASATIESDARGKVRDMARIVVSECLTVDGVMQAPGGPDEDRSDGFEHGGWQLQEHPDPAVGEFVIGGLQEAGGFLLGRRTYDIFAAYWPTQEDGPIAPI